MPSEITFAPATQAYVNDYFGGAPPYGFRGYVALLDGAVVGIGGVFMYGGVPVAFSQMKDPMRPFIKAKARAARLLEKYIDDMRIPVYATADPNEPTSGKLLEKLGFQPTGVESGYGEMLVRRPKCSCSHF